MKVSGVCPVGSIQLVDTPIYNKKQHNLATFRNLHKTFPIMIIIVLSCASEKYSYNKNESFVFHTSTSDPISQQHKWSLDIFTNN